MSGVVVGTRLEQLYALQARVGVAIALELRQLARGDRPAHGRVTPETTPALPRQESSPESPVRVPVSAVRPALVRDWATTHGIPTTGSGTLPREVVSAYVQAHQ